MPEGLSEDLEERVRGLQLLYEIGIALSVEKNRQSLLERILLEAKGLCNADGGTLYLVEGEESLRFEIVRTDSLGIAMGGTTGSEINFPNIPLYSADGAPNLKNVASYAATKKQSVNIRDAYHEDGFDFSGTRAFDKNTGYRAKSFLTIPMINADDEVIGVLQLINSRDADTGEVEDFDAEKQRIVEALASQAAVALANQILQDELTELLDAFIMMIAAAIDAKSPYTGGHCERVPIITEMLARAACDADEGPYADFDLNKQEWYELHIAAWLHDCGKVTTPVHVMDKATKLETIYDRIETVRTRFEIARLEARLRCSQAIGRGGDAHELEEACQAEIDALDEALAFLEKANIGGEFLEEEKKTRIAELGQRTVQIDGKAVPLLSEDEIANLQVSRGTLTDDERLIVNGHMVQTIKMLESLPFPRHLRRVPEYAGGHHEKLDGTGYPKGLYAGDMSIPARMMAIADVFEALTAQDRPYKAAKPLSEAMRIMGSFKENNHLDPDLMDLFVSSGVYREYGKKYLPPELFDEVDEAALLAIEPKPLDLPPPAERAKRWEGFLPEYLHLLASATGS